MSRENPYEAPEQVSTARAPDPATMLWSAVVVFGCTILGGMIGLAAGATLGTLAPGYYRSLFNNGGEPHFDPLAVGMGQGLTQGIGFGAVVGVILVGMYYWYRLRFSRETRR